MTLIGRHCVAGVEQRLRVVTRGARAALLIWKPMLKRLHKETGNEN
jgi:hypothetical protein